MANCKENCIHYKVCMYGDLTEYKTEQILKDDCDDFMPKDVVPKSEVEALKHQLEMIIDEGEYWEGKFSVAQSTIEKIFEEMEKSVASKLPMQVRPAGNYDDFIDGFRDGKTDALIEVLVLIAQLKKKYIESEIPLTNTEWKFAEKISCEQPDLSDVKFVDEDGNITHPLQNDWNEKPPYEESEDTK